MTSRRMVTRSGCASAARLKGRCPLISAKVGIGHTNSSHFGGGVNCLGPRFLHSYARGWRRPPPPQRLHPSGGDGCQGWSSVRKWPNQKPLPEFCRDGRDARPVEVGPPAGATDAGGTSPNLVSQPLPRGSATKRVLSPFLTRTRTVRLPCVRAVVMTSRTSVGVDTDLPATSRMTSPVENP